MDKLFLVMIFSLLKMQLCYSQLPDDFPSLNKDDLPGIRISSSRVFNGTSLYGYIDGGADLYLEYGFDLMSVDESEYMGGKFKIEIYKMNGPEEAFGIFSISKYRCLGMPPVSDFTCQTKYQLQISKGPYYINIINHNGTRSDSLASIKIARVITEKINESDADLLSYLPGIDTEVLKRKCILVKGRIGIVNGIPELEDYFRGITDFTSLILNDTTNTTISVMFRNKESYNSFLELHQIEDKKISSEPTNWSAGIVRKVGDNKLLIELAQK